MATQASPLTQNISSLSQLLGLFTDTKQFKETSGGTSTSQTMFSKEAVDSMLRTLMESNQGLASVASGQKAPGLYNTTVRTQLVNDLLARSAGQVAEKTAPKVETKTPIRETSITPAKISPMTGLLGAAAIYAGSKGGRKKLEELLSGFGGAEGTSTLGRIATGMDTTSGVAAADIAAGMLPSITSDLGSSALDAMTSFWDFGGDSFVSSGFDALSSAMSGVDAAGSAAWDMAALGWGDVASSGLDVGMPGVGSMLNLLTGNNPGGAAGESAVLSMIPGVGPILSIANALDVPVVSDVVDAVGDVVSSVGDAVGCFITTATCEFQGKPDDCDELTILRKYRDGWLQDNYPELIKKYYAEAPAIVQKLKERDDAPVVFNAFYKDYIVPAVEAIESNANDLALAIYKNLFNLAEELAAEQE